MEFNFVSWLPVLGAVLGSGSAAAIVNQYFLKRHAEIELRRKKLEELYILVEEFYLSVLCISLPWQYLARGEINRETAMDQVDEYGPKENRRIQIELMANIYFPSIKPELSAFLELLKRLTSINSEIRYASREGGMPDRAADRSQEAMTRFDECRKTLLEKIVEKSRYL